MNKLPDFLENMQDPSDLSGDDTGMARNFAEFKEATDAVSPEPSAVDQVRVMLRDRPPAVAGEDGNLHTFATASLAKSLGATETQCLGLMLEDWNQRCEPPWSEDELSEIVHQAYAFNGSAPVVTFTPGPDAKNPYVNPKDLQGMKKVPLHLVPATGTMAEAMAFLDGAIKYDPYNWRDKHVVASIYVAACKRHIDDWFEGQMNAPDSDVPHLGHAKACLGILIDAEANDCLVDDRPKNVGAYQRMKAVYEALIAKWREDGRFDG